jgi:uncharacterized membrane protein
MTRIMKLNSGVSENRYSCFPGMASRWMQFFLVANIILGVIAGLRVRDFGFADESAHYFRALEVSQGHWINTVNHVGVSISCAEYKEVGTANGPIWGLIDVDAIAAANPDKPCVTDTRNTAGTYSPIQYIFSGAGIALATAAGLDVQGKHDAGRIFNAVGNTVIIFLALCLVRQHRSLLAFLSAIPLAFLMRASLSADAVATSACFLFLCVLLRLAEDKGGQDSQRVLWLFVAAVFVGATKPLYSILPFSAVILWKHQANIMASIRRLAILLSPGFVSTLIAFFLASAADSSLIHVPSGASPHEQLLGILHDPLRYADVLGRTFEKNAADWLEQIAGNSYKVVYVSLAVLLCASSATALGAVQRILLLLMALAISLGTVSTLYIVYTGLGNAEILGIQGRLFMPAIVIALVAVAFEKTNFSLNPLIRDTVAYVCPVAMIAHCLKYNLLGLGS